MPDKDVLLHSAHAYVNMALNTVQEATAKLVRVNTNPVNDRALSDLTIANAALNKVLEYVTAELHQ